MGLEIVGPTSLPDVLNVNWPLGNDPLNRGDDHLRNIKITLSNFYTVFTDYQTANDAAILALQNLFNGGVALDSEKLGGVAADQYALKNGDYVDLRARSTTKGDVGLGLVNNWDATSSIDENDPAKYATAAGVYAAARNAATNTGINQVGTYAYTKIVAGAAVHPGNTKNGADLKAVSIISDFGDYQLSGTWRNMGLALFVRIS